MFLKRITVFTPTYNRAHLLNNLYQSLIKQNNTDFEWLIIDDGSTDNTKEVVDEFIGENKISIRYAYKENGGLHTGYNKAIELMDTELSVCIDSDDYLYENAIDTILNYWDKNEDKHIAGLIGLDITKNGKVIGDYLPDVKEIDPVMLLAKNVKGDKKYVMRNAYYKEVAPMPVFNGEKNFNPHYMVIKLSKKYKFLVLNEPLCVVDYQEDGMSANIYKQYLNSPNSFAELRRAIMSADTPFFYLCKTTIHYISSCLLSNQPVIKNSPKKILTTILFPVGYLLKVHIENNAHKILNMKGEN